MASQFIEAIMAQSLARRDPEVQAAVSYLNADAEQVRDNVSVSKATTIDLIDQKMAAAVARNAPPKVLQAYEQLLDRVTAS